MESFLSASLESRLATIYESFIAPLVHFQLCYQTQFGEEYLDKNYLLDLTELISLSKFVQKCVDEKLPPKECGDMCVQRSYTSFRFRSNFIEVFQNATKVLFKELHGYDYSEYKEKYGIVQEVKQEEVEFIAAKFDIESALSSQGLNLVQEQGNGQIWYKERTFSNSAAQVVSKN